VQSVFGDTLYLSYQRRKQASVDFVSFAERPF
jgi:hypothetical protein